MKKSLAPYIDATILKSSATSAEITKLCAEAKEYEFACVCVSGQWVPFCAKILEENKTKVCSVVGFPLGTESTVSKAQDARELVLQGASEIDMVLSLGSYFSGDYEYVLQDIATVRQAIRLAARDARKDAILKVILETCYLSNKDITTLCKMCLKAGAEFVKTSTGFGSAGATVEHVQLMKNAVKDKAQVKASGGIRNYNTAKAMIKAGASRIGTSSGVEIVCKKPPSTKGSY